MTVYTLGFIWTPNNHVALVEKTSPSWQKGLLNGLGGKVEKDDMYATDAMIREIQEEVNLTIYPENTHLFATMYGNDYLMHCFSIEVANFDNMRLQTDIGDQVYIFDYDDFHSWKRRIIPNLEFLLPLSKYKNIKHTIFMDYVN